MGPRGAPGALSQPGGPLYGIGVSNGGLVTFPGELPLPAADGTVIGAIGVSGATVEDDGAVAEAGAAALSALPVSFEKPLRVGGAPGGGVLGK